MIALALALVCTLGTAPDEDWRSDEQFQRGAEAFAAEQWDEAAEAFAAAYAEHERPELLWARAQALRLGGRCDEAVDVYRQFLAGNPSEADAQDARTNIEACGGRVEEPAPEPEPAPDPAPAPAPAPVVVAPPIDTIPPPRPVARDPWGHALTWGGLAVAAVGAGLLADAHARSNAAADNELDYRRSREGARTESQAGIGVLVTGSALLTAGIIRFTVLAVQARRRGAPRGRTTRRATARHAP